MRISSSRSSRSPPRTSLRAAAKNICPHTGRARLSYDRARILPDQYTRTPTAPDGTCINCATSAATHHREANAGL